MAIRVEQCAKFEAIPIIMHGTPVIVEIVWTFYLKSVPAKLKNI